MVDIGRAPKLPIPIWLTASKYLIFDPDVASFLRAEHRITGVAVGTLPQVPQQNVFSGLPLQLMAEEVQLLVEEGVAVVLDNAAWHRDALKRESRAGMESAYRKYLQAEGLAAAKMNAKKFDERRRVGLAKQAEKMAKKQKKQNFEVEKSGKLRDLEVTEASNVEAVKYTDDGHMERGEDEEVCKETRSPAVDGNEVEEDLELSRAEEADLSGLEKMRSLSLSSSVTTTNLESLVITPTTSNQLLNLESESTISLPTAVPSSHPLFRSLHKKGYYLSPGLRFGCQYLVYPGDPLRFHSHFCAVSREWDEDFKLLDIVRGGRLGTGVKKALMMGAQVPEDEGEDDNGDDVRAFSIEWAAM